MSSDGSTLDSENEAVARFHEHLKSSPRIMALLGAGLSASSGLATFRGAGECRGNADDSALLQYD